MEQGEVRPQDTSVHSYSFLVDFPTKKRRFQAGFGCGCNMKGTSLIIQIIKSSGFLSDLPLVFLAWFALVSCFELRCRPWDFFHPGYECYMQLCSDVFIAHYKEFAMNQPRFHGMSFVSFVAVAVAGIAGRPVSSKSY